MSRQLAISLTIALSLLFVSRVRAETRLSVSEFLGPEGDRLRSEAEHLFARQEGVTVIPHSEVEQLARKLGVDAESPDGRKILARELQLSAWVTGSVRNRSSTMYLTLVVYDGAEHARVGRIVLSGRSSRRLRHALRDDLWDKSKDALFLAVAPLPAGRGVPGDTQLTSSASNTAILAAASERGGEGALPHGDEVRDDTSGPRSHRWNVDTARIALGVGTPYRSFTFSDPITPSLSNAQLSAVPMFDASFAYYPGRAVTDGWASWIGLDAAAALSLSASTSDPEGNKSSSRYGAYRIGARGRIPVGRHSVSAFSGYAITRLSIDSSAKDLPPRTPDIDYRTVRSGAGAELTLTDSIALGLDVAWLKYLSVGELGTWFPRATAVGVELGLTASYALSSHLFARLSAAYQRTAFDFRSRPGDAQAAGGATDQYLTMSVGVGASL